MNFDLAISYTWIYDTEFTQLIEKLFQENEMTTFVITRSNIEETTRLARENKISFKAYLDRASDVDESFAELATLLSNSDCRIINNYAKVESAVDKARVQNKLLEAGMPLPNTMIIPPFDSSPQFVIPENFLNKIGTPFIIKPAYYSGGSEGVKKFAHSVEDIHTARRENGDDNYLIQEKIYPAVVNGHRAWFRVFWFFGKVVPLLWNDETLFYSETSAKLIFSDTIETIKDMMQKLYCIAGLDYFSSEFALTEDNELFLIDYVNDQCDMRLKSKHVDGVPDEVIEMFIIELISLIKKL